MYEYSLSSFLRTFQLSLETSKQDPTLEGRLRSIVDALTFDVYNYTCTGLFEKHKLMLSFQMTISIADGENHLNRQHLEFFLKGNLSLEKAKKPKPYDWIPDQGWQDIVQMITLGPQFVTVGEHLEKNESSWRTWYEQEKPEEFPLPGGLSEKLKTLEQLLVLRCFRIDRITVALTVNN